MTGSTSTATGSLEALLASREVVVFCGSGGVGKTSVAAASAVAAATRIGGKVLVLTIDPARRLADALGIEAFGNVERRVDLKPYTDDEPANTRRLTPASRAATSTLRVPSMLAVLEATGSLTERGTDGMAPWWST